jgi:predicted alpha/beta-hydrolase family hydrolase
MEINFLIHGNSEGFNSQFMQFVNDGLTKAGKETYGFDFDYIVNGTSPSKDFIEEHLKIKGTMNDYINKGYTKVNLIGKSLGGVLCLDDEIVNNATVTKIVILGFPYLLGYPADLSLLKTKPVVGKPNFRDEYSQQFKKLGRGLSKVNIVQGASDLLCNPEKLEGLNKSVGNAINIIKIDNASHGFKPVNADTTVEQNYNKVVSAILSVV